MTKCSKPRKIEDSGIRKHVYKEYVSFEVVEDVCANETKENLRISCYRWNGLESEQTMKFQVAVENDLPKPNMVTPAMQVSV